jgi:hypothetical protein
MLAFSILVCLLVPVGLFGLVLVLQYYLYQPPETEPLPPRPVASVASEEQVPAMEPESPPVSPPTGFSAQIAEIVSSSVTSDKSVDDLANNFQQWMGLPSRVSQPKAAASTILDFDIDTAQLHEVTRHEKKPGKVEYQAVLIDAQGRTVEIKLTEAEGRETYALMQRIKANPLLEKVYRQIAMPILDSLVQSAREQLKSPAPARQK